MAPGLSADPTFADWLDRVREELGGRDPVETLSSHAVGAPSVRPLYTAADRPAPNGYRPIGATGPGRLAIQPRGATLGEINAVILAGLAGGASALRPPAAALADSDSLERSLRDVVLDAVTLDLAAGAEGPAVARRVRAWLDEKETPAARIRVRVGADPFGALAARGTPRHSLDLHLEELGELAATCDAELPAWRAVEVTGAPYHEAGADDVHELGAALAATVAYLRALERAGLPPDRASRQIGWSLILGRDLFLQIAKMRAARALWQRLQAALAVESPPPLHLHAAGSRRTLTRYDRWVNLLRGTTQAAAALLGGADTVTVEPFDAALGGAPSERGERLGRNTLHVLELESALGSIADPAGGSFYLESLTDDLARAAWDEMRRIEGEGGMAEALRAGSLQARIAERAAERRAALATRREPITGISEYADLGEERPPGPEPGHSPRGRGEGEDGGLPLRRDAEDFERLRDAALGAPEPPRVFLANLGPLGRHGARSLFATNALAAGGIGVVAGAGTGSTKADEAVAAVVATFRGSGLRATCLCGDDELYGSLGAAAVQALKAAGAAPLWVVVPPGDLADSLLAGGAQAIVHLECDLVARLEELHGALGIGGDGS
jgi:methylmalonyl-CoA mutase